MSEERKRYDECDLASNHSKVCGCVVSNTELDKWKSLAGELMLAAEKAMNALDGLPFKRNFDARNALAKVMDKMREIEL